MISNLTLAWTGYPHTLLLLLLPSKISYIHWIYHKVKIFLKCASLQGRSPNRVNTEFVYWLASHVLRFLTAEFRMVSLICFCELVMIHLIRQQTPPSFRHLAPVLSECSNISFISQQKARPSPTFPKTFTRKKHSKGTPYLTIFKTKFVSLCGKSEWNLLS